MSLSQQPLARLIYLSRKSPACAVMDLSEILETARKRNSELGVTGLLCFSGEYFLQVLEGLPEAVNALYAQILRDGRHQNARLLSYDDLIEQRAFSKWSMGYVHSLDLDPEILQAFHPEGRFVPQEMDGASALAFLATVSRSHQGLQPDRRLPESAHEAGI